MKNPYNANLRKAVIQFDMEGNEIKTFTSVSEAAKTLNLPAATIGNWCSGKTNGCVKRLNCTFKFLEDLKEID